MKKRVISLALALVMCLAMLPAAALATDSDFTIVTLAGMPTLTKYNGPGGNVVVPDTVQCIGTGAFSGNETVTSVTIPSTVTKINNNAFSYCTALTCVNIPGSVTSIGDYAFAYCAALTGTLEIPCGVTRIGERAFWYCTSITGLSLPSGLTEIGYDAFCGCSAITGKIVVPDSVTNLGIAFMYCEGITEAVLPKGLTALPDGLFCGCKSLKRVTLPNGITTISPRVFSGCASLAEINIPDGVTRICESAFKGCKSLTKIDLPNSITNIEKYAFSGCAGLTGTLTLPYGLTELGEHAFADCTGLTGTVIVPGGVKSLAATFYGCTGIERVDICSGLEILRGYVFSGCTSLKCITIPSTVTRFGYDAFDPTLSSHLQDIYYTGTREQWANIKDGYDDFPDVTGNHLDAFTIHYNAPEAEMPSAFNVSAWAAVSVNRAFDMGIGNQFSVRDCTVPITRKQFAQLAIDTIMRTGPADAVDLLYAYYFEPTPFTDVDDSSVTVAYKMGIVSGYGGGRFGPDDLITREQAAAMLSRLAVAMGKPMTAKSVPFTDAISDWAKAGVECCYGSGIMSGVGDNLFDAGGNYTVEQSLITMVRLYDYAAN